MTPAEFIHAIRNMVAEICDTPVCLDTQHPGAMTDSEIVVLEARIGEVLRQAKQFAQIQRRTEMATTQGIDIL